MKNFYYYNSSLTILNMLSIPKMNFFLCLIWIFLLLLCKSKHANCYLGINWGRYASQRMIPSMVVDMLLQNGIKEVKLFSASRNVLEAFVESNIGVTVTIPNDVLELLNDNNEAKKWVETNIVSFVQRGVDIRYVNVGAEPYSKMYFNRTYYEAVDALNSIQKALSEVDFGGKIIKATMNHFTDILNQVKIPSKGDFAADIKDLMIRTCKILNETNAPLFLDMFPIYNAKVQFNNDIEFAFFDNNSTSAFMDGDKMYRNVFEVMYDTLVHALEKNGFPNLKIVVGQLGWPTDGIEGANIYNAERFYKGFLKFHYSGKGTPLRPGPIDTYLYNLADENKLPIKQGAFLRHWGIYRFDGEPKFNIDFTGKGRDIKIISVKGITHMPKRWCVFNNKTNDLNKLQRLFNDACSKSDCTSLAHGGSCGNLGFPHNISYAFNMLFQMRSQKVSDEACQYEGLGIIVPDDPSTDTCRFPVEILSAEVTNGNIMANSKSAKKHPRSFGIIIFLSLALLFLL